MAVVDGGSWATGREVGRALAGRGYAIVVVYLADQRRAELTVDELLSAGATAVAVRADIADELDVARLFDETIAVFGRVDVLVHTTTESGSALYRHAARSMSRRGVIVGVATGEPTPRVVDRALQERGITLNEIPPAPTPPGDRDVAALMAVLDRWRDGADPPDATGSAEHRCR